MEPRRRYAAAVTAGAILLVVVGFGVALIDPGLSVAGPGGVASETSTPRASVSNARPTFTQSARSAGPSKSATPRPTPSGDTSVPPGPTRHPNGFAPLGDGFVYYGEDGSLVPVPEIPGLVIQIQSGRAIYYALGSNKYGLKTGSYAGEFLPLINMGQIDGSSGDTGGVVLSGPVVSRLLSDALAQISTDADRWLVALPVDVRSSRGSLVDVSFDSFGLAGWTNTPRVRISFPGSVPLVESIPTNGGFHALVESLGVTAWQVIDPVRLGLPTDAIDPAHAMNELLIYGDGTVSAGHDVLVDGRVAVGTPIMNVTSDVSVSLAVKGSHAALGPDKILKVGDSPVFVASN
jgi:hypothetical protein